MLITGYVENEPALMLTAQSGRTDDNVIESY